MSNLECSECPPCPCYRARLCAATLIFELSEIHDVVAGTPPGLKGDQQVHPAAVDLIKGIDRRIAHCHRDLAYGAASPESIFLGVAVLIIAAG